MPENQNETDWKTLRKLVPELRERYLKERNRELEELLADDSATATERFWKASERTEEIAKLLRACFDRHTRSRMLEILLLMYRVGILLEDDLGQFSGETQRKVKELQRF